MTLESEMMFEEGGHESNVVNGSQPETAFKSWASVLPTLFNSQAPDTDLVEQQLAPRTSALGQLSRISFTTELPCSLALWTD